jgi:hypothetical protein
MKTAFDNVIFLNRGNSNVSTDMKNRLTAINRMRNGIVVKPVAMRVAVGNRKLPLFREKYLGKRSRKRRKSNMLFNLQVKRGLATGVAKIETGSGRRAGV